MKNNIIDISQLNLYDNDNCSCAPVLIIKEKTGIFYEDQCGGYACTAPNQEGYLMILPFEPLIAFDKLDIKFYSCDFGCWGGKEFIYKDRDKAAHFLDSILREMPKDELSLSFDFDSIEEFQENWWPVKVKRGEREDRAILTGTGNCD